MWLFSVIVLNFIIGIARITKYEDSRVICVERVERYAYDYVSLVYVTNKNTRSKLIHDMRAQGNIIIVILP